MTSRDQATAAFVSRIATVADGALVGIGLAVCAATSWMRYLSIQSALHRIHDAPLVPISDLRTLLQNPNEQEDSESGGGGKLVVVRGRVQPKPDSSSYAVSLTGKGFGGALISQGSDERAVIVKQIQTCIYNEWRGIFGWRFDLHAILAKSWKEQKSSSMRSVPFILVEGSHWPNVGYINVSLDNSSQPLPLTTVYHQLHPVQNSAYTFLQIIFGHGFPVALLDEEKILPVGKELTAVGICKIREGALEVKSVPEFPCFLSEKTKGEIEVDLSVDARILFWSGIVLGTLSLGILSYAVVRLLDPNPICLQVTSICLPSITLPWKPLTSPRFTLMLEFHFFTRLTTFWTPQILTYGATIKDQTTSTIPPQSDLDTSTIHAQNRSTP